MFISVSSNYSPIKVFEVNLKSPLSGEVETLELVLYSLTVETWLSRNVRKKPTATYRVKTTGEDIAAAHWTDEMEAFYKECAATCTPVPGAGTRLTVGGKVMVALAALFILFMAFAIVKELTYNRWQKADATEEVTKAPVTGDEYHIGLPIVTYGPDGEPTSRGVNILWCRVVGTEPDGSLRLKMTEPLGANEQLDGPFAKEVGADGTFTAVFRMEAAKSSSSYPTIFFQSTGSGERLEVFFYGSVEKAKRPAK